MYLFGSFLIIWIISYILYVYPIAVQSIKSGHDVRGQWVSQANMSKRSIPVVNITAPRYIIDAGKDVQITAVGMTDYACGAGRFCNSTNSFFNYAALCFKCEACRCDEMCRYHGDCCNDILIDDSPDTAFSPSPYVSCVSKLEDEKKVKDRQRMLSLGPGLLMVTRCPEGFDRDDRLVSKCEKPEMSNLHQATPIWSAASKVVFRNQFCASCHGLQQDYELWKVSAHCNQSSSFSKVRSMADAWTTMWHSQDCILNSTAPTSAVSRPCRLEVKSTCRKEWGHRSDTIGRMCHRFTSAVRYGNIWYQNVFCAVCNGAKLDRRKICRAPEIHSGVAPLPPLSVLLDFYPKSTDKLVQPMTKYEPTRCPHDEVFNRLVERCQKVRCPARRFYDGNSCEKVFKTVTGLGYEVSFSLKTTKDFYVSSPDSIARRYERKLRRRFVQFRPYALVPVKLAVVGKRYGRGIFRVSSLEVFVRIVSSCNASLDQLEEELLKLRREPWTYVKGDLSSRFVPSTFFSTTQSQKNNGRMGEVDVTGISKSDPTFVFGKRCRSKQCMQHVRFIPVNGQLMCPYVEINTTELQSTLSYVNSSIVFGDYTVDLNRTNHRKLGETIQTCVSVLNAFEEILESEDESTDEPENPEDYPKAIISTVCLSVSVVCLFLTFIVYAMLPSLQTLPGKNTMAMVSHLFMSQLLFLTGIDATSDTIVCRLLAVTTHYFWLTSFSWMFVCAYHMYSIFSNLVDNTKSVTRMRSEKRKFIQYFFFANLSSVCLVVICVVYFLIRTSGAGIGYGGQICFLNTRDAVGIFFAAPLLLVLIFNCFFFIRTVMSIRRTPNVDTANKSNRNYIAIYFRLSILLGFGWIFGFLPQTFVIFCIFTVLTAGQGVFIFVSFCVNRRVWNMLRHRSQPQRETPKSEHKLVGSHANSTNMASV